MATSIDSPPVYDYLTKNKDGINQDYMSNVWRDYMATFYETLISYITEFGMFPPSLTQDQIDQIQTPRLAQFLYNTTIDAPQIYTSVGWKTFTLT